MQHTYKFTIQLQNSTLCNVPLHAAGWEHEFVVPKQYSESMMMAAASRKITEKHKNEIVQEICYRMIKQQGIVAAKLVQKFPPLRDTSFTSGHVSLVRKQKML